MSKHTPKTRAEAEWWDYTVDRHCYPWVAYMGPRFRPDELVEVLTDLEAELLQALKKAREYVPQLRENLGDLRMIDAAIEKAEGGQEG